MVSCIYGENLLKNISFLRSTLPSIRHHHERFDGKGYPDGLAGINIPLPARIFAVVDVWDALTSERPYRASWNKDDAFKHMEELAGTIKDNLVVIKVDEDKDVKVRVTKGSIVHKETEKDAEKKKPS